MDDIGQSSGCINNKDVARDMESFTKDANVGSNDCKSNKTQSNQSESIILSTGKQRLLDILADN